MALFVEGKFDLRRSSMAKYPDIKPLKVEDALRIAWSSPGHED